MRAPLAAVLLVGVLLAPGAAASHQSGHPAVPTLVTVDSPGGLFSPLGEYATVNITVAMDCGVARSTALLNFSVQGQPHWLFVQSMPGWDTFLNNYTVQYSDDQCNAATGYFTIQEPMVANFTTYAPAYRHANFTVVVSRTGDVKYADGSLQPSYFGELEVVEPPQIVRVKATDRKAEVPFRVRNLGNGETTVRLEYVVPEGVRLEAPDVMVLGASQQGGQWDKPLDIVLYLDDVREDFSVEVKAIGFSRNASDQRSAEGDEGLTTVDVQRQVPAPGLALAAAAAAAVALLRRRQGSP